MITYKILKPVLLTSFFLLVSCTGSKGSNSVTSSGITPESKKNRCIHHNFRQGGDDDLYGLECIEGKELKIKSAENGVPITLMSTDKEIKDSVIIEQGIDFINHVYELEYDILKDKGDDKEIPFLLDFIKEGEIFRGQLDQEYSVVFKTSGNYLILYKAASDVNNIPYNERTSMIEEKRGGETLYMVPFIGYPIQYCSVEFIENAQRERTRDLRADCDDEPSKNKPYIQLRTGQKQIFSYQDKKDVFPIDYFAGEWFYTSTQINSEVTSELASADSNLVKIERKLDKLTIIDNSGIDEVGGVYELSKRVLTEIPIKSLDFELDKQNEIFSGFRERLNEDKDVIQRPYIQILFQNMSEVGDLEKVIISPDYFSFVYIKNQTRFKVSFLRKSYLQFDQFKAKRWFEDDDFKTINLLKVVPQRIIESTQISEDERLEHHRVLKFDTSLYGKEKQSKTKVIKWYFSKNSSKKEHYREIVREAMAIYNRAFEIIADGEAPKIQYQLIEGEGQDKDLGDMRYNMINLIDLELVDWVGVLGYAPSHHNPETGQIISGISNINITPTVDSFIKFVKNYTRYEIFQSSSDKTASDKTDGHPAISTYLFLKIQKECHELEDFIATKKSERMAGKFWDYATEFNDLDILRACAIKISKPAFLDLVLHELGHNTSEGHNFECSVDEDNFYKDLDEMKAYFPSADLSYLEDLQKHGINPIPQTSCVMDYIPLEVVPLPVLGKNDLRNLRYVYEDEIELEGHELDSPKVYPISFNYDNVKDQISLKDKNIPNVKSYRNCNDEATQTVLAKGCDQFDYGASYVEIVKNELKKLQRALTTRFRYNSIGLSSRFNRHIKNINFYYLEWLNKRDLILGGSLRDLLDYNIKTADEDVRVYKEAINPKYSKELASNQDYLDYYPIADIFNKTFKNYYNQKPLHCLIKDKDNNKDEITLSYLIENHLKNKYSRDLYIIDCFSHKVTKFFTEKGFEVVGQEGIHENDTFSISDDLKVNKNTDVFHLFRVFFDHLTLMGQPIEPPLIQRLFSSHVRDLEALVNYDRELKKSSLNIDTYGSSLNILKNDMMAAIIRDYIQKTVDQDSNVLYLRDVAFFKQDMEATNPESAFSQRIEARVKKDYDKGLNEFNYPFLKALYKQYIESRSEKKSFQDYVIDQNSIMKIGSIIYIPVEENSHSFRMAVEYNKALEESTILKSKSNANLLEVFRLYKIDGFIDHIEKGNFLVLKN